MQVEHVAPTDLTLEEEQRLLALAREALVAAIARGEDDLEPAAVTPALQRPQATFVTLSNDGALRGCVGHIFPEAPLYRDVMENAVAAATRDYRFPAVTPGEIRWLALSISLLTLPQPLRATPAELPGLLRRRDGLVLEYRGFRGVLLPEMWEYLPRPEKFLDALCTKAGLPTGAWRDPAVNLLAFQTAIVSEPGFRLELAG